MFSREMSNSIDDVYTIGDVKALEEVCQRYLELDKVIFGCENEMDRRYTLIPNIGPNNFHLNVHITIRDKDPYNYIYLDYTSPLFKNIEITVQTLEDVSDDILHEFCGLHKKLFGVPVQICHSGWNKNQTGLIFGNLNKDDSQN